MCLVNVKKLIFSFLVIVYGEFEFVLLIEKVRIGGMINLYGILKVMVE